MSGEKIQVREGWWRQRCGNVVRIIGRKGSGRHPWTDGIATTWSNEGRYSYDDNPRDLVHYYGQNITITAADIDIPELRVPILFWVCPDCPGSVVTWHRGVATCDNCGQTSAD